LNNITHKLFSKTVLALAMKITIAILGFVFHFVLARQLPVAEFGLFTVALTILAFTSAFAKQGFEQVIVRAVAHTRDNSIFSFYCYTLMRSALYALVIGVIIWLFSDNIANSLFQKPSLQSLLLLVATLTIIQVWLALNSAVLRGRGLAFESIAFTGGVTLAIAVSIIVLNVIVIETAYDGLVVFAFSATAACCLSFIRTLAKIKCHRVTFTELKTNQVHSRASKHFFVISMAALITQQFSTLVLTRYVLLEHVAAFAIALKIALLATYPLVALNAITAPKYAQLYQDKDFQGFKDLGQLTGKVLLLCSTVIMAIFVIAAHYLVLFLGEGYQLAFPLALILLSGQWVNLATGSAVSMLAMAGFEKLHKRNTLVLVGINVIALLIVVPSYGVYGAAIVTSTMIAVKNMLALFFVHKLIYQAHVKASE
jgi:O-antigen/teichoic acid export membrane protein